jgi:hypothetical protein
MGDVMFQFVFKGIPDLSDDDARRTMQAGILCNWWRRVRTLPNPEVRGRLTQRELDDHIARYWATVPGETYTVGENSPFISTTAGTYQAQNSKTYKYFSAELTAISFATRQSRTDGVIFRAWLPVLGRPSLPLAQFAEELRDPNQYPKAYGFHHQGEVTAKIEIPTAQIEGFWTVSAIATKSSLKTGASSVLGAMTAINPNYVAPDDFTNVRDVT